MYVSRMCVYEIKPFTMCTGFRQRTPDRESLKLSVLVFCACNALRVTHGGRWIAQRQVKMSLHSYVRTCVRVYMCVRARACVCARTGARVCVCVLRVCVCVWVCAEIIEPKCEGDGLKEDVKGEDDIEYTIHSQYVIYYYDAFTYDTFTYDALTYGGRVSSTYF